MLADRTPLPAAEPTISLPSHLPPHTRKRNDQGGASGQGPATSETATLTLPEAVHNHFLPRYFNPLPSCAYSPPCTRAVRSYTNSCPSHSFLQLAAPHSFSPVSTRALSRTFTATILCEDHLRVSPPPIKLVIGHHSTAYCLYRLPATMHQRLAHKYMSTPSLLPMPLLLIVPCPQAIGDQSRVAC